MANLQKIVKVTQAQYDTLASGGTVGSYTGLDDNYVYLIEDTNTYITSNGGTIDGGDLTIEGNARLNVAYGNGVHIYNTNHDTIAGLGADMFGNEIIYNSSNNYQPLFANDTSALIYSDNGDYLSDFTFYTGELKIYDGSDTGHTIYFDAETYEIGHGADGARYYATLPSATGTIALTSDIINVVANPSTTTATLTGITIGNTSYSIQGGVTDVQINGTSILSNTVANFVTKTAYNSSTNKIATESDLAQVKRYI